MRSPVSIAAGSGLILALAAGCSTTSETDADGAPPASVWTYLLERYDRDADGRIAADEYSREGDGFGRLDTDADGVLTAADLERAGDDIGPYVNALRAQAVIARHFQEDDDDETLLLEELEWSFTLFDDDGDGQVTAAEFDALAATHAHELAEGARRMLRVASAMSSAVAPFDALLAAADEDGDGRLGRTELVGFFHAMSVGGRPWSLGREALLEPGAGGGVAPGTLAPDFTLRPPDGGEPVTLSSFRGDRPVALVFGSYT